MIHERALLYRLTYQSPRGVIGPWPGPLGAEEGSTYAPPQPYPTRGKVDRPVDGNLSQSLKTHGAGLSLMGCDLIVLEWVAEIWSVIN